MKVISYSLFGYGRATPENCFEFNTYLRGLWINIRLARVLYPDWKVIVNTDQQTWNQFEDLFRMMQKFNVSFYCNDYTELCEAMLWRMKPIWMDGVTHTICRDLDSPLTYREAQMVNEWLQTEKVCHAITDSVSHNIPLLGGMVGFTKHFKDQFNNYHSLVNGYDLREKGSDQLLLVNRVYPKYAQHGSDSILQHYILGMPNTFLIGYKNTYNDEPIENVNPRYKETNDVCGHIGAAGYYEPPMLKFLCRYDEYKNEYKELESKYKQLFYWSNE